MNPRLLTGTMASLLLAVTARAVIDTWDGGGANDNLSTALNWIDNTAPASDLANTDLIFSGGTRLTPNVIGIFSAHSVIFDNVVSGAALGFSIGGQKLHLGTGGILNNDSHTAQFSNSVDFSGVATSTINAASGAFYFFNTITLPTGTLTVTGSSDTLVVGDISGAGTLNKTGAGTMSWANEGFGNLDVSIDVTVEAGTLFLGLDSLLPVLHSGATIAVNGGALNMDGGLTLDGGALTRATGATLNLPAGKTLTVQNGGDVAITGAFTHSTASTLTVTGAGSSFTGNSTLAFGASGGSVLNVLAGGTVAATGINIGTGGDGTATVSGSGSSMSAGSLFLGASGHDGSLTFSSASTGMFAGINVDVSSFAGTGGSLSIPSGATVTGTGLSIATGTAVNTGTVSVTGAGSALTLSGAATATIGAASASSGSLNVSTGGTFDSGTGATTVNATGLINIAGGTYHSNGDLALVAGQLTRSSSGVFDLAAGTTFTIQGGGDATITGSFGNTTASTIHLTGGGSTLSTTSTLAINGGSSLIVSVGSDVSTGGGALSVGTLGDGTVSVTNPGSTMSAGTLGIGLSGSAGSVTFSNSSTGAFGAMNVDDSLTSGTSGLLQIQSGATVTGTGLSLANQTSINTGTVTITGASSALTLSGAATATIGAATRSTGAFDVLSSGMFNSGTGLTTVNKTGTVAITGGTFNANGNMTLNAGQLTRDSAGAFNLAAGKTLTVQGGGDAAFTGGFSAPTNATITVTGAGSTFSTTSSLTLGNGSTTAVSAAGHIDSGTAGTFIGTSGGNGAVTVDGSGSNFTGGALSLGQNGFTGNLTFTNGSTGGFNGISVDVGGVTGGVGTLSIQSGANVTGTSLNVATTAALNIGIVTITGAGSALTLSAGATIGAPGSSAGSVTINSGGTFTTGSGLTTVNATGSINVHAGGTLTGASDFAGTGPVNIAGTYLPGSASGADQTTSVSFAQNMTFQPGTSITMELGGTAPGTQHDQLVFNGPGATQVVWNGTLNLVLINGFVPQAGQFFDLFDFDASRDAGAFSTVTVVNPLPAGLAFDFGELYTTGIVRIVSTGGTTFAQWAAAALGDPGALPHGNHDGDIYDNLTEYALANLLAVAGASEPAGGFHVYADGERLRLLFWRHIDRTDITLRVQGSSDLTNWDDLALSVNSAPFTGAGFVSEDRAHPLSDPGLVEVRDTVTTSIGARRYVRIQVTLAP